MADSDGVSQLTRTSAARTERSGRTEQTGPRHIISVDYGTTYTGVAWVLTKGDVSNPSTLADIHTIESWSGHNEPKVPSKITYSATQGHMERWGYGVGGSTYILKETKLDLEEGRRPDALAALLRTIEALDGMTIDEHTNVLADDIPRHMIKKPVEIVTDYLTFIAKSVCRAIKAGNDSYAFGQFPVDLIFTHPVEWDPRARNLTFRAVTASFGKVFPEIARTNGKIYMATESEACAQYTMRDSEEGAVQSLAKGDCFIVVDAGGGTVDLATYQVKEIKPFRVKLATDPSGDRCGAAYIDDRFLTDFLPRRLSRADIHRLRFSAGSQDRLGGAVHKSLRRGEELLLEQFMVLKHNFEGLSDDGQVPPPSWINLPDGVGTPNEARLIKPGQLGITCEDMMYMFYDSLQGTMDLIKDQIRELDVRGLPAAQAIFFSGGFSRNKYVRKELEKCARSLGLDHYSGSDSWTAVAKGAALMAMDVGCGPLLQPNIPCPFHIGVVLSTRYMSFEHDAQQKYTDTFDRIDRAKEHIQWFVSMGDLVTYDEGIKERVKIVRKFKPSASMRGRIVVVVSRSDRPREPPSKFKVEDDDTRSSCPLSYDLATITPEQRRRSPAAFRTVQNEFGVSYHQVELELEIRVRQQFSAAEVRLIWGRTDGDAYAPGEPGCPLSRTEYITF